MDTVNITRDILKKLLSLWSGLTNGFTASSTALAASLIVKPSAGKLHTVAVYNGNVGTQFIQIHNSATLPADTAVPLFVFSMATGTVQVLDFSFLGLKCTNGIVLCNSSTAATKTIGANNTWFCVTYR